MDIQAATTQRKTIWGPDNVGGNANGAAKTATQVIFLYLMFYRKKKSDLIEAMKIFNTCNIYKFIKSNVKCQKYNLNSIINSRSMKRENSLKMKKKLAVKSWK